MMRSRPLKWLPLPSAAVLFTACSALLSIPERSLPGAECVASGDCAGSQPLCEQGRCTLVCTVDGDCPDDTACVTQRCRATGTTPFGGQCTHPENCETGLCEDGLCLASCVEDLDCQNGSACVARLCQPVVRAGFLFDAIVSNVTSGFAYTHDLGRLAAEGQLPWLQTLSSQGHDTTTVNDGIESLLDDGADVIFVTSGLFFPQAAAKAADNPGTKFFTCGARSTPNHIGYAARFHQAWFIAGFVAATFDLSVIQAGRIGFIAPRAVPEVIRELNAFARGVRSVAPNTTVEVIWANSFDPSPEVTGKLVDYLVTGGNRIIVNRLRSRTVNDYVDALPTSPRIYSIGLNNIDACASTPDSCLGAPYRNWGVLYTRLLREIRNGTFDPDIAINEPIRPDPATSSIYFALNDEHIEQLRSIRDDVTNLVAAVVGPNGEDTSLAGPYCATRPDQRSPRCIEEGEIISDEELGTMCWLMEGIVQHANPEDPTSPLVDAFAPDGTIAWPPNVVDPTSISRPSCRP